MKLLIRHGRIMNPETNLDMVGDILIDGQIIRAIAADLGQEADGSTRIIDASGLVVSPGLMDAHVHFRDPGFTWKEDIETGSRSAARGGFTTVLCMANTNPVVDNIETLRYCLEKGKKGPVHLLQAAALTKGLKGEELCDLKALAEAGASAFTDDGIPVLNERLLLSAMEEAKALDIPISLHEEHPMLVGAPGVNQGRVSELLHYAGASSGAEDVMVARDCMLALDTGAKVCIQHISSAASVAMVRLAKSLGADVFAEATPHHFTLTEDAVLQYGTNARMNPPLRREEDRMAVIGGLQDGTIDMIVTDHAPHSAEEKARDMAKAPSGIIGLETSLGLAVLSLVQPGFMTLMDVLRCMTIAPAKLYHADAGRLEEGRIADLCLFGEKEVWTADHFVSKASNSPFLGWELPGKIHMTICQGQIVYEA